jgi:hypothetical protein
LPGHPRRRSLSVGERLSAPLSALCPIPLDVAPGGRRHRRHRSYSNYECPLPTTPIIRVIREGEGRRSYSLPPASAESRRGAPLSPTPFQRRGCELPVGLLGPCGAFTESCRPLTFSLSPPGTPESKSFSPDVLLIAGVSTLLPTETGVRLTRRSEDPASPQRFPDKTGQSPRTPSVVFRISELSPEDDLLSESCSDPLSTPVPFRLLPLRAPTSGKLRSSSRLAPSLSHRPTLRSTGEEDARCVEPTSATHTNYVHPHLARSRLAPLVAQRGRPPETKAPDDTIGGPSVSRHPRPLRRTVTAC